MKTVWDIENQRYWGHIYLLRKQFLILLKCKDRDQKVSGEVRVL